MINNKMKKLGQEGSIIRELNEYGQQLKKQIGEDNVFDFSIGNPSVPCPEVVKQEIIRLTNTIDPITLHSYTSANGLKNVRDAIALQLNKTYNANISSDLIYLTSGASAALTISFNALLNKNDEVIVIAPFFPEYKVFVEKANGKLVVSNSDIKTCLPDFNDLENKINSKTKIIVINSPNNPTGVLYKEDVIIKLANLLKRKQEEYHHDIYLLSDEPYRELIYIDCKYPFITNYYDNSLVCYSFSKSLSLPGERVGYLLVSNSCHNKNVIYQAICGAGRSLGFICLTTLFQYILPICVNYVADLSTYKENKDLLYNALIKMGYQAIYPDGAFYLYVKALEEDANLFANNAKKFNLLLVPSDSFGQKGFVRISYCVTTKQIINSLPAFKKLKEYYQKRS